jgi:hypothetical protein
VGYRTPLERSTNMAVSTKETTEKATPTRKKRVNGLLDSQEKAALNQLAPEIPEGTTLWEYISGFTSDDWTQHIGYLWMVDPMIDRRMAGKPKSIDKYSRPFDLQLIKEEHGSGNYRLDFCRIARNGNAQKRIHQEYFGIIDMKYPPRIPYGDWITWPENKDWLWCAPLLKKEADEVRQAAEGSNSAAAAAAEGTTMFKTILEGVRTLRGESGENEGLAAALLAMVQASNDRMMDMNDPVKQLQTVETLLSKIAPKQDNTAFTLIIDMLREDLKAQRIEVKQLREAQAANQPKDVISQIVENAPRLAEIAKLFGFSPGGKGGGSGTDWGGVVAQSIERITEHVPLFFEAWKLNKMTGGQQPQTNAQPWRPGVVTDTPAAVAAATPAAAAPVTAPSPATPPAAAADDAPEADRIEAAKKKMAWADQKYGQLLKTVAPHLVDMFRANVTGYDFRDWLIDRHGRNNWTAVRDEVGAETMTQLCMAHPMLRAALSPVGETPGERLFAFLKETFTDIGKEDADRFTPADPDEDDDGEADIPADPDEARNPPAPKKEKTAA